MKCSASNVSSPRDRTIVVFAVSEFNSNRFGVTAPCAQLKFITFSFVLQLTLIIVANCKIKII